MANTRTTKKAPVIVNIPSEENMTDPLVNPEKSNAEIAALLSEAVNTPVIEFPPDDLVMLPGGLLKNDILINSGIVKELTGRDEEALARASQSFNLFHFFDRLLSCGVVKLGNNPDINLDTTLRELLIGDRAALILGIRKATYGDKVEISKWVCQNCNKESALSMEISDIPVKTLNSVEDTVFEVGLRNGGHARVRLANGADQLEIMEKPDLTQAQIETLFLSKCVIEIVDNRGFSRQMIAFPQMSLDMSVPDRHAILKELSERQPGPQYDKIEYECAFCGKKGLITVGIGDLFLDFGWI
jgi:hypothetical protein